MEEFDLHCESCGSSTVLTNIEATKKQKPAFCPFCGDPLDYEDIEDDETDFEDWD